ncbi:Hypothetical protein POVN_LOCUS11 [uncultured virus]|nr:Hypothetical protein POVN_LOCUS11 [uncultured virus]
MATLTKPTEKVEIKQHPYIAPIESGTRDEGFKQLASEVKQSLEDRIERLKKVDLNATFSDSELSWTDQIMLVALGLKPIAVTHYDEPSTSGADREAEDWCVEQMGVDSFVVMKVMAPNEVYAEARKAGAEALLYLPSGTEVERIVWFRQDTRKLALLARHHIRLQQKGKDWIMPYFDIIQGIIYGYPRDEIVEYVTQRGQKDEYPPELIEQAMQAADVYIQEKTKEFA